MGIIEINYAIMKQWKFINCLLKCEQKLALFKKTINLKKLFIWFNNDLHEINVITITSNLEIINDL